MDNMSQRNTTRHSNNAARPSTGDGAVRLDGIPLPHLRVVSDDAAPLAFGDTRVSADHAAIAGALYARSSQPRKRNQKQRNQK
jgi:hypothetical protein